MHQTGSPNGEGTFEYGLHLILDGIGGTLRRPTTPRNDAQGRSLSPRRAGIANAGTGAVS